jgi:hypothetical protein
MLFLSLSIGTRASAQQRIPLAEPQMIPVASPDSDLMKPAPVEITTTPEPANFRTGDTVVLREEETINRDFFAAGENVEIYGTVNGDVYVAGGDVLVEGIVNGEVIAAGGKVHISGSVERARAIGGTIIFNALSSENVSLVGGDIEITKNALLRNLVAAGGTIVVNGPVKGDLAALAGDFTLNNTVGNDVNVRAEKVEITKNGWYGGKLHQYDMAQKHEGKERPARAPYRGIFHDLFALLTAVNTLSLLALGLLLIYLMPNFMRATTDIMRAQPWKSMGIGVLALFLTPLVAVLLMVTLIGLPLSFIILLMFGIGLYMVQFFVIFWLGQFIVGKLNKTWHDGYVFTVGLFFFTLLKLVPVIGWAFHMVAFFIGLGGFILAKKELMTTLKKKKLI